MSASLFRLTFIQRLAAVTDKQTQANIEHTAHHNTVIP